MKTRIFGKKLSVRKKVIRHLATIPKSDDTCTTTSAEETCPMATFVADRS